MSDDGWLADDADLFDGRALEDLLDGGGGDEGAESFLSLGPLVAAARRPPSGAELAGEAEAMAVYRRLRTRAVAPSGARRRRHRGLKLIAIAGAVTMATATGAAAATGGLPGPVQDTAATLLGTVGISVPDGGGVPAGQPVPPPAATAPDETVTAVIVADTTVEVEATPPISTEVTVAVTSVAPEAAAPPRAEPGPAAGGDDAKPGKGGADQTDDPGPPHDSSGKAIGQAADHTPPGQAGTDHQPGAGATKPKPPKAPKATAGPAATVSG